jgi:hypothetical protein
MLCNKIPIEKKPVSKVDVYNVQMDHLLLPEPWFKSFGMRISVKEYNLEEYNTIKDDMTHLYCKLLLKDIPSDSTYFIMRNIDKLYHFTKCANYIETNVLENISMLFTKPKNKNNSLDTEKYFVISFRNIKL